MCRAWRKLPLLVSGILSACLLCACDRVDYVEPDIPASKKDLLLSSAREVLRQHVDWLGEAEYRIARKGNQWHVTAWRVVHPENKGSERYVPWGSKTAVLDDQGNPVRYF